MNNTVGRTDIGVEKRRWNVYAYVYRHVVTLRTGVTSGTPRKATTDSE